MLNNLPFFPPQASTSAAQVDALYFYLIGISGLMSLLIAGLLIGFAVRYRRRSRASRAGAVDGSMKLELIWTIIPFFVAMSIFVWGAGVFFHLSRPPDDAMNILVVGKRWMWKLQHLNGRREINELHVPLGRAVRLTMTSEDVIHSFYVPAFRVKADVLPGRYTSLWFEPTRPGRYHLFCAEYCGTRHSGMVGWVVVMRPEEFQTWLGGDARDVAPARAGERLFTNLGCATCHNPGSGARGPSLQGVFGSTIALKGGARASADESYLRESILDPQAKLVDGYEALMPTFRGLVGEEGLMQIIEYLKTLEPAAAQPGGTPQS